MKKYLSIYFEHKFCTLKSLLGPINNDNNIFVRDRSNHRAFGVQNCF